ELHPSHSGILRELPQETCRSQRAAEPILVSKISRRETEWQKRVHVQPSLHRLGPTSIRLHALQLQPFSVPRPFYPPSEVVVFVFRSIVLRSRELRSLRHCPLAQSRR